MCFLVSCCALLTLRPNYAPAASASVLKPLNRSSRHKKAAETRRFSGFFYSLVPGAGIEPARLAARDFESRASTNSTTRATLLREFLKNLRSLKLWHSAWL
jgi:hypothetical protein